MKNHTNASLTCSTREAAEALGISVRTAQLWVEDGRLQAWKTPGGHRRILRTSVDQLIGQQQEAAFSSKSGITIHILDSDQVHREALRARLLDSFPGTLITLSGNAFEGLLKMGEHTPDVLITDLDVIGIDNFRMFNTVDRSPLLHSMLVIVRSTDQAALLAAAKRLPPDFSLLAKQESPDELLRLLRAYVQGRQNNRRSA